MVQVIFQFSRFHLSSFIFQKADLVVGKHSQIWIALLITNAAIAAGIARFARYESQIVILSAFFAGSAIQLGLLESASTQR
nr:hypothetical protein [Pseudomonas syringae pv. actinidiae]